ncbi:unnamed protein product [Caenorhabditis brenneri]
MYSVSATATKAVNCTNVMLRNHFIVNVSVDKVAQIAIGTYYALLIIIEASLFGVLLAIHFKIRKGCHPFFGVVRKALLPVIVLDSLVTLVDGLSSEITTRIEEQDDTSCHSMIKYAPYIILNHVAMVLEYSIPLYMLFRRAYRRQLPEMCRKIRGSSRIQQSRDSMIQNVFGQELNVVPTQNEYFAKLQMEWK